MRKVNLLLVLVILIGTLLFVLFDYDSSRILTYLAVIPVLVAPLLLIRTKYRLGERELFCYYLFIFFADFLGCVANLYNMFFWYDQLIHFVSGIFTFGVGLFLLEKSSMKGRTFLFDMLFCICLVMFVAGVWEFFEYGVDYFLGMNLQHHLDTGVVDTMEDMLFAFLGGFISIDVCFWLKRK